MVNRLNVIINNRTYTLASDESVEYMQKLTDTVNSEIAAIKEKNPSLTGDKPVVLAALNICEKYFKADNGGKALMESFQKKYDDIVSENKRLNNILSESDYEIDIAALRHEVESLKRENELLKSRLK